MSRYAGRRRSSSGAGSRWMALRYAGTCKVCGTAIPQGETAYWDAAAKTTTCWDLACCEADGLTEHRSPSGPWDNPEGTVVRRDQRLGRPADVHPNAVRVIVTRFNSGAVVTQNANGRCEDAPCCGCCTG